MPVFAGPVRHNDPGSPIVILDENQVAGLGVVTSIEERNAISAFVRRRGYIAQVISGTTTDVYVYVGPGPADPNSPTSLISNTDWENESNWVPISSGISSFNDLEYIPDIVNTIGGAYGTVSILGSSPITVDTNVDNSTITISSEDIGVNAVAHTQQTGRSDLYTYSVIDDVKTLSPTYLKVEIGSDATENLHIGNTLDAHLVVGVSGIERTDNSSVNIKNLSSSGSLNLVSNENATISSAGSLTLSAGSNLFLNKFSFGGSLGANSSDVNKIFYLSGYNSENDIFTVGIKNEETFDGVQFTGNQVLGNIGFYQGPNSLGLRNDFCFKENTETDTTYLEVDKFLFTTPNGTAIENITISNQSGGNVSIDKLMANGAFTFPTTAGDASYVLASDGNGGTYWAVQTTPENTNSGVITLNGKNGNVVLLGQSNVLTVTPVDNTQQIQLSFVGTTDQVLEGSNNKYYSTSLHNADTQTYLNANYGYLPALASITDTGSGIIITDAERTLLNSLVSNVQADWEETNSDAESYILNKPDVPATTDDLLEGTNNKYNIQSNWNAEPNTLAEILNKPDIPQLISDAIGGLVIPEVPSTIVTSIGGADGTISLLGGNDIEVSDPVEGEITISYTGTGGGDPYYLGDLLDAESYDVDTNFPTDRKIVISDGTSWVYEELKVPATSDFSELEYPNYVNLAALPENASERLIIIQEQDTYKKVPYDYIWSELANAVYNQLQSYGYGDAIIGSGTGLTGDLDNSGTVGTADLLILLANFGSLPATSIDIGVSSAQTPAFSFTYVSDEFGVGPEQLFSNQTLKFPPTETWYPDSNVGAAETQVAVSADGSAPYDDKVTFTGLTPLMYNNLAIGLNVAITGTITFPVEASYLRFYAKVTRRFNYDGGLIERSEYYLLYEGTDLTAGLHVIDINHNISNVSERVSSIFESISAPFNYNVEGADGQLFFPHDYFILNEGINQVEAAVSHADLQSIEVRIIPFYMATDGSNVGSNFTQTLYTVKIVSQ